MRTIHQIEELVNIHINKYQEMVIQCEREFTQLAEKIFQEDVLPFLEEHHLGFDSEHLMFFPTEKTPMEKFGLGECVDVECVEAIVIDPDFLPDGLFDLLEFNADFGPFHWCLGECMPCRFYDCQTQSFSIEHPNQAEVS